MPDIGFVNGRFMPLSQAAVSVEDRGYQFGDGIYEVIRTYRGVPFQLDAHIARLERSAAALDLPLPFPTSEWSTHVDAGIRQAHYPECKVYIQVTRGTAPRDHSFPLSPAPTAVMTVREMHDLDAHLREAGVTAVTVQDLRWGRCDIKTTNLLPNVMARQQAQKAGAFEAIFVRSGEVAEGAVSNIMVVRAGTLITPPSGPRLLSGVTRAVVLNLARKEGIQIEERTVTVGELHSADELFLTGTTFEILPVVRVDEAVIGSGRPGDLSSLLYTRFRSVAS